MSQTLLVEIRQAVNEAQPKGKKNYNNKQNISLLSEQEYIQFFIHVFINSGFFVIK